MAAITDETLRKILNAVYEEGLKNSRALAKCTYKADWTHPERISEYLFDRTHFRFSTIMESSLYRRLKAAGLDAHAEKLLDVRDQMHRK